MTLSVSSSLIRLAAPSLPARIERAALMSWRERAASGMASRIPTGGGGEDDLEWDVGDAPVVVISASSFVGS